MISSRLFTNKGKRPSNEDHIGRIRTDNCVTFMVADGLGGHGFGEVASDIAIKSCKNAAQVFEDPIEVIENSFVTAEQKVLELQQSDYKYSDMMTTLVQFVIQKNIGVWGHIGDSRLYHFRRDKLISHTKDHSVPQMLVNMGEIADSDIRGHEDRNRLLKAIGTEWNGNAYEIAEPIRLKKSDSFLLCTDGFWELIEEDAMERFLVEAETIDQWLDLMVNEIVKNGLEKDMDNYSAIAIWLG